MLGQTIYNLQQTDVHDIVVITGHEAEPVTAVAHQYGVSAIHNPHYQTGEMLSSLQKGVATLAEEVTAVLVILADQPMLETAVIDQILTAYWQQTSDLIAPTYQGRRGHPVLIGRHYFQALLALPPGDAPRTLLQQHHQQLHLLPVTSQTILQDLDTPEAYAQLRPK